MKEFSDVVVISPLHCISQSAVRACMRMYVFFTLLFQRRTTQTCRCFEAFLLTLQRAQGHLSQGTVITVMGILIG